MKPGKSGRKYAVRTMTARASRQSPAAKVLQLARSERAKALGRLEMAQKHFDALPHKRRLERMRSDLAEWDRILRALMGIGPELPAEPAPAGRKCIQCGTPAWARSDKCLRCSSDPGRSPGKQPAFLRCKCGRSRLATKTVCDICEALEKKAG